MKNENIDLSSPDGFSSPEAPGTGFPDLATELRKRDMFCLHGIALDSVGLNSSLDETVSLENRFRTAIADAPALSTVVHTGQSTTSKAALWSTVGVFIGGGKIQAASPRDMSSRMVDGGHRQAPEQSEAQISEALDAITTNDIRYPLDPPHNEVVVQNPVVTGLYFKDTAGLYEYQINRQQVVDQPNTVPDLIRRLADEYRLPIFAVRTSGVFEVRQFDTETGRYILSSETAPKVHSAEAIDQFERQVSIGAVAVQGADETQRPGMKNI